MEKKLTDEEIIEALKECEYEGKAFYRFSDGCNIYHPHISELALDLIHRLQSENNRLNDIEFTKEHCDLYSENEFLKAELKRECEEHLAFTELAKKADEQQKAEIERLTEENKTVLNRSTMWKRLHTEVCEENAELQKQVDELTKPLYDEDLFNLGYAKAVKDTAKEIYSDIGDDDILIISTEYGTIEVVPLERLQEIIKGKGVDVE